MKQHTNLTQNRHIDKYLCMKRTSHENGCFTYVDEDGTTHGMSISKLIPCPLEHGRKLSYPIYKVESTKKGCIEQKPAFSQERGTTYFPFTHIVEKGFDIKHTSTSVNMQQMIQTAESKIEKLRRECEQQKAQLLKTETAITKMEMKRKHLEDFRDVANGPSGMDRVLKRSKTFSPSDIQTLSDQYSRIKYQLIPVRDRDKIQERIMASVDDPERTTIGVVKKEPYNILYLSIEDLVRDISLSLNSDIGLNAVVDHVINEFKKTHNQPCEIHNSILLHRFEANTPAEWTFSCGDVIANIVIPIKEFRTRPPNNNCKNGSKQSHTEPIAMLNIHSNVHGFGQTEVFPGEVYILPSKTMHRFIGKKNTPWCALSMQISQKTQ